jgi:hypothetical protein
MSSPSQQDIEAVIANGRRLVKEARETLASSQAFLAEHGLDPESLLEAVRSESGDAAAEIARIQVQSAIEKMESEMQRQRLHGEKPRPVTQRVRVHANRI